MLGRSFGAGLLPEFSSPPLSSSEAILDITAEAAVTSGPKESLRVVPICEVGQVVAQGAPLVQLRDAPEFQLVAPMPARVAHIRLLPGHRLSEIVLFHERGGDRKDHKTKNPRRLMQATGMWQWLQRRPFGGMPSVDEVPAAIFVMAADTRPLAVDPRDTLAHREEDFARGLRSLATLTAGPVFVVQSKGPQLVDTGSSDDRVKVVTCGPRHPQGSAGYQIHSLFPAGLDAPVWDIHAEDVAALGELIETGFVPETRLVRIAGPALRESRLVRTQPGSDLRGLTYRLALPGGHSLISGSPLDGKRAHWLAPRDRQVSVLQHPSDPPRVHWLRAALTRSSMAPPVIPTAALTQAFGAALPAATFIRALAAGDEEMAMELGVLSLLDDDLALADYVLGTQHRFSELLNVMLNRIEAEYAA